MYCSNCGHEIENEEKFCPNCGMEIGTEKIDVDGAEQQSNLDEQRIKPDRKKLIWMIGAILIAIIIILGGYYVYQKCFRPHHEERSGQIAIENNKKTGKASRETSMETPTATAVPTPSTSIQHEYTVVKEMMTWEEARIYCEEQGGYLAVVTDQEEYDIITKKATESGLQVLWLGGKRGESDGFLWINDDTFSFNAWANGEPNNDGGNENYLDMMYVGKEWKWYDVPSDLSDTYGADRVGFVMEKEIEVENENDR